MVAEVSWLVVMVLILGTIGFLAWKWQSAVTENAELRDKLNRCAAPGHICRPPVWASRGPDGWIRPEALRHWVCACETRFVLVRVARPRPDGPFRLGWITVAEHRTGRPPSWVHQEPESRLGALPPGQHRKAAL